MRIFAIHICRCMMQLVLMGVFWGPWVGTGTQCTVLHLRKMVCCTTLHWSCTTSSSLQDLVRIFVQVNCLHLAGQTKLLYCGITALKECWNLCKLFMKIDLSTLFFLHLHWFLLSCYIQECIKPVTEVHIFLSVVQVVLIGCNICKLRMHAQARLCRNWCNRW